MEALTDKQICEEGRLNSLGGENFLPVTVKYFWTAFDDFLAISAGVSEHPDTKLVLGAGRPSNGVGSEVVFKFKDQETREVLWQKDDLNHIWCIGIPEENIDFSYYRGTFTAWEGSEGPRGKYAVDVILKGDDKHKLNTMSLMKNIGYRVLDVCFYLLRRDGTKSHFEFELDCPVEKFWNVISNWSDISWVMAAEGVEMLPNMYDRPNRRVKTAAGDIEEVSLSQDPATHTLSYYAYKTTMPTQMYQGTMKLTQCPNHHHKTRVTYESLYLVKEGVDVQRFKAGLEEGFKSKNIPFLQEKFAHKA